MASVGEEASSSTRPFGHGVRINDGSTLLGGLASTVKSVVSSQRRHDADLQGSSTRAFVCALMEEPSSVAWSFGRETREEFFGHVLLVGLRTHDVDESRETTSHWMPDGQAQPFSRSRLRVCYYKKMALTCVSKNVRSYVCGIN